MKIADFLAQSFTEETTNHMATLRNELLTAGLIKTFEQKYLYTEESKRMALDWYARELVRQDGEGSTGSYGKLFEVSTRIEWSILHKTPYAIDDVKSRNCKLNDMTAKIDGAVHRIELKTGHGAIVQGADRAECLAEFAKLLKSNKLFVWDYLKDGCPMCYKVADLFAKLEEYNGEIDTWLVWKDGNGERSTALSFQTFHTSKKKMAHLEGMAFESYDWQTIMEGATFGE